MDNKIVLKNVSYTYASENIDARQALQNINLTINAGEFITIVGKTGSGKSTLVRLLNGLLTATSGEVIVKQSLITKKMSKKALLKIRSKVGMIFQSPENQLFADTVLDDVSFGPQNFGKSKEEAEQLAKQILTEVGISADLFKRSPFELSGGQMRRVAIAGVLAMQPSILILDEPTVGLDEIGRNEILTMIKKLNEQQHVTILLITHNMQVVSEFAERVIMLNHGQILSDTNPQTFFMQLANEASLPDSVKIYKELAKNGINLEELPLNKKQLVDQVLKKLAK
ncbi:energy-coupling factor transporter ATPase [Fructilactobacillus sanfranciscensis]|uniref:energy-coupling factor transporter ATPase n=1 Tax=Fructilactobacillus sanfranciscensis TaxID=1625 RepID=UPI000CD3B06F|nr:energy-coupling factor transporter ATPase [Fructilactobacillus sanfranciscensis]POH11918.1 energy-coupling factor transporter ATPase [Fructilactobacillus sanfranciscensis]POH12589.1 energy-coupling factor transporter ATPase [Fructilactobacillus sanfranciscensis]POH16540.1 energy-coupling factor transporter ATPase [Fructilactobacillus sanfranciscensis]